MMLYFRTSLIKSKTKILKTKLIVNKRHCLYINPISSKWKTICSTDDEDCLGDTNCNQNECKVGDELLTNTDE